jgi:uncharacterized protein
MKPSICFAANDIRTEGIAVDVELSPSWLLAQLREAGVPEIGVPGAGLSVPEGDGPAVRVKGRLSRSGNDIVVRARVRTAVAVPCVRCLDPADVHVDAEMSLLLQPSRVETRRGPDARRGRRPNGDEDEYEFSAAEAEVDVYDGETVVLDDFVRELILLEIPSFPVCKDDCPGLGQGHRAVSELLQEQRSSEVDPRLAPLGAFRQSSERDAARPVTVDDLVQAAAARSGAISGRKPVLRSNQKGPGRRRKGKK